MITAHGTTTLTGWLAQQIPGKTSDKAPPKTPPHHLRVADRTFIIYLVTPRPSAKNGSAQCNPPPRCQTNHIAHCRQLGMHSPRSTTTIVAHTSIIKQAEPTQEAGHHNHPPHEHKRSNTPNLSPCNPPFSPSRWQTLIPGSARPGRHEARTPTVHNVRSYHTTTTMIVL